jgi:hypothetical protein
MNRVALFFNKIQVRNLKGGLLQYLPWISLPNLFMETKTGHRRGQYNNYL